MDRNNIKNEASIICYLDIPYTFEEVIDVYQKENVTLEQLFILYNNLKQVKVRATITNDGSNNYVTIEVV